MALALLVLAPVLLGLPDVISLAPALVSGGPETIAQLLTFLGTMGRSLLILIEKLAAPLAALGLCSLTLALALNRLWIGAVSHLRAAHNGGS